MIDSAKRIVVTGGAGFVGTHLCRRLREQGREVISLDLREPTNPVPGVYYRLGDVRDLELLKAIVNDAHAIYHLAATVSVPLCQENPLESYSNNFTATLGVLETVRRQSKASGNAPIPLVFSSTAAIYSNRGDDGRALRESDAAEEFSSYYAAQKHASEKAIQLYALHHGVPAIIFRFFNIYGPGQDPQSPYSGVITVFNQWAKEGRALQLNGGGHQTRDFISVHDIVAACIDALGLPRDKWDAKPINLGTGEKLTIRDLGEIINKIHGNSAGMARAPSRDGDVTHSLASIERARSLFGFMPRQQLAASLLEI